MSLVRLSLAPAAASLVVVLAASTALAAPLPDNACRGAKLKAAGKYAAAVLGCDAKAAKDGSAVEPACLAKGSGKLTDAFATAESKNEVDCNGLDLTTKAVVEEVCPTKMLWEMRADGAGDDRATEIDIGWKGDGHDMDPSSGSPVTFALDCAAENAPCGTCDVTGFDAAAGNCRCANDPRTVCDEPLAADADDCGGAQCECYVRVTSRKRRLRDRLPELACEPLDAARPGPPFPCVSTASRRARRVEPGTWRTAAARSS